MTTAKERALAAARASAALEQFSRMVDAPLTKQVAIAICRRVYGATKCACDKRKDMPACETMVGAAMSAIRILRSDAGP